MPGICFKGIHKINTHKLIRKVISPMLYPKVLEKPSAKTVHGLIPALAVIIIDSPNPNNPNPKQSMNEVKGLGA